MGVKLVVAVTDGDWFEMLRQHPDLPEVNFWSPAPKNFKALERGELFLFKLHAPRNFIVGGGIFAYANKLPSSLAWDAFGEADGARSLRQMRERIVKYRRDEADPRTQGFHDWLPDSDRACLLPGERLDTRTAELGPEYRVSQAIGHR